MSSRCRNSKSRQKIRDSCNSCSSQKIRCSKERPSCARCINKGLECSYSFSQRTGRRARTRSSSVGTVTSLINSTIDPSALGLGVDDLGDFSSHQPVTQSFSPLLHGGNAVFSGTNANAIDDAAGFQELESGIPWELLWSNTGIIPHNLLGNSTEVASTQNNAHLPLCTPSDPWPSLRPATASSTTKPTAPASQEQPVKQTTGTHSLGQDCMMLALQVVLDLHISQSSCLTAASDPMIMQSSSKRDARDIDAVLFQNRDAIKSVNKVLDCPCSADQSVALACYLAVAKVLAWYGAAIGFDDGQRRGSGDSNQPMADRIVPRPIFIGRYCLDPEAQRSVRANVVLTELREHILPLLLKLPKHFISSLARPDQGSLATSSSSSRASDGQPCALRDQLKNVIQEANTISKGA